MSMSPEDQVSVFASVFLRLTWPAGNAESPAVPNQLHALLVDLDQPDRVHVGQDPAVEATCPHLVGGPHHEEPI